MTALLEVDGIEAGYGGVGAVRGGGLGGEPGPAGAL